MDGYVGGAINDSVELFRKLKNSGKYKFYALTNWQADLFNIALVRYNYLHWFNGRVISGVEKTRIPFPEFYQRLIDRYNIDVSKALFIDDNLRNVQGAIDTGIDSIHFQSTEQLNAELMKRGVITN